MSSQEWSQAEVFGHMARTGDGAKATAAHTGRSAATIKTWLRRLGDPRKGTPEHTRAEWAAIPEPLAGSPSEAPAGSPTPAAAPPDESSVPIGRRGNSRSPSPHQHPPPEPPEPPPAPAPGPAEAPAPPSGAEEVVEEASAELGPVLEQFIELTPRQRQAICWRQTEGVSLREISRRLGYRDHSTVAAWFRDPVVQAAEARLVLHLSVGNLLALRTGHILGSSGLLEDQLSLRQLVRVAQEDLAQATEAHARAQERLAEATGPEAPPPEDTEADGQDADEPHRPRLVRLPPPRRAAPLVSVSKLEEAVLLTAGAQDSARRVLVALMREYRAHVESLHRVFPIQKALELLGEDALRVALGGEVDPPEDVGADLSIEDLEADVETLDREVANLRRIQERLDGEGAA